MAIRSPLLYHTYTLLGWKNEVIKRIIILPQEEASWMFHVFSLETWSCDQHSRGHTQNIDSQLGGSW